MRDGPPWVRKKRKGAGVVSRMRELSEQRCRGGNRLSDQKSSLREETAPGNGALEGKKTPPNPHSANLPVLPSLPAAPEAEHVSVPPVPHSMGISQLFSLSPTHRSKQPSSRSHRKQDGLSWPFPASLPSQASGTPDSYPGSGCTSFHGKKSSHTHNTALHLLQILQ